MTIKWMMTNTRRTEDEIDAIVNDILNENQENDFDTTERESCPGDCEDPNDLPKETARQCTCGVENSSRFSLRVMEAMRLLQRDVDQPSTSSAEDIVDCIRTNYRNDGDLYAQVRTALRQVCSQGFVMEILNNEYHLIGPVVSAAKRNGCSLDCRGRVSTTINDTSKYRKTIDNHRYDACGCERFSRRNGRPEDSSARPIFHSTAISMNERDNSNYRDDTRQRDITGIRKIERRDEDEEPIPGSSRKPFTRRPSPIPARDAKRARIEERKAERADEDDEETTEEEDADPELRRDEYPRRRRDDRARVVVGNGDRRERDVDDERAEEEDEDTEDGALREVRVPGPRRRNRARERELRDWIRHCREECERRGMQ